MDSLIGEAATEWGSPSPRAVKALALSSVLTWDSGWYLLETSSVDDSLLFPCEVERASI